MCIQSYGERLKLCEVAAFAAGNDEHAVVVGTYGRDVDLRARPHEQHLGVAPKAGAIKTHYFLDSGLAGERMMYDQRNAPRIAASGEATDFAQGLCHVRVGVQVVDSEIAQRIEHNDVRISFGNGIRNTFAVLHVEG